MFCVTYAYSGYAMVAHIRDMIAAGEIGEIRFVNAEYPQEWLTTKLEATGQKQALSRTDPKLAGLSNCVGDIGSHIEFMAGHMTGLRIESLCARLDHFGPDRPLEDNATIMVNYKGGAKGVYWCSQIAMGHDNSLRLRIYGTKGAVEWFQETPNSARVSLLDRPTAYLSRGRDPMSPRAQGLSA
jgi:predicted dehydrogenase